MKFGALLYRGLFGVKTIDGGFERIISTARRAEELEYDFAWMTDESWWTPDPITYASMIVKETRRIKVGILGMNPYVRHPLSLALSFHTFAEIAEGRGVVGVCAGSEARLKKLGVRRVKPLAAVKETIELIRRLPRGPLEYEGEHVKVSAVNALWVKNGVKVYVCANGPRMLELAGRMAEGVVMAHVPPRYTKWGLPFVKKGLEATGKAMPQFDYAAQPPTFIDENREKAFKAAESYLQFLPPPLALHTPGILEECGFTAEEADTVRRAFREAFASPVTALPSELVEKLLQTFAITGTPDEAVEKVKGYERAGVTHVIPGFTPDLDAAENLAYFKKRVIDRL